MKQFSKLVLALSLSVSAGAAFSAPATLGALFTFTGTGASAGMSGSIYDKDIHSGVFRDVNAAPSGLSGPLGTLSDSYVLQGGDPFGGDTQDNFEVSQASGHAVVSSFFDVFTEYDFNSGAFPGCGSQVGTCIAANPDSGWLTFVNNSGGVWTGDVSLTGQAFGGIYGPAQFFANSATGLSIANGGSVNIALNFESSNFGGYNHPDALPEPGSVALTGLALLGLVGSMTRRRKGTVSA